MAITTFVPAIWEARLLHNLEKASVAKAFVNKNYEGNIKNAGDTVKINFISAITIGTYTANTDMSAAENLTTTPKTLTISQSKYFNFQVDDIDRVQAAGDLVDGAMREASYGLSDVKDAYLFGVMASGRDSGNKVVKTTDAYADVVALRVKLDKANVPTIGRKVAVTPDFYALILQDKHFVENSDSALAIAKTGFVGTVLGMEVYVTNNLPTGVHAIATVDSATTLAEQISEIEAYRPELRFADAIKGLDLYGSCVIYPTAIATLETS